MLARLAKHVIHPVLTDDPSAFVGIYLDFSPVDGQNNSSPSFSHTIHPIHPSSFTCARTLPTAGSSPRSCIFLPHHFAMGFLTSSSSSPNVESRSSWNIVVVRWSIRALSTRETSSYTVLPLARWSLVLFSRKSLVDRVPFAACIVFLTIIYMFWCCLLIYSSACLFWCRWDWNCDEAE